VNLYQEPGAQISLNFLYMLPVAVTRSSSGGVVICTSGFVDMFSHDGSYGA